MASYGATLVASFTRPANTTGYTAGDVVGATAAALAFSLTYGGSEVPGPAMITSAELEIDRTTVISGETTYTLHLYSVTPPSAAADNAAFDLPSGDRASYLGSISLGTPVDLGATCYVGTNNIGKQFVFPDAGLFGYLQTVGAYTPESATVHKITLHIVF